MRRFPGILVLLMSFFQVTPCLADVSKSDAATVYKNVVSPKPKTQVIKGPVEERANKEEKLPPNYFSIAFYKPTYILPYYYTGSPDSAIYRNNTPGDEGIKSAEVKYQFSIKVPVWKNIVKSSSLYFAYTQLSYWQVYNNSAFFRESNYEPELIFANEINFHLFKALNVNFLNAGAVHQSNGYGNTMERSWNRLYIEAISSAGNWMVSIRPWYVVSKNSNNNDISQFLGYGQATVAYKHHNQIFSIAARNVLESHGRRATTELTWSFPLTPYIKGYVEVFSGYGQSLIEYNHRTNSAGVGIALSDWL